MIRYWSFMLMCLCSASLAVAQTTYTVVPLPPAQGFPSAFDPSGPLVGTGAIPSDAPGRPDQPALFTEAGPVLLGLLENGTFGIGAGVCGAYTTGVASTGPRGLRTHAFLAVAGEPVLRDLGDGDRFSAGSDVNCRGEVAGRTADPGFDRIIPSWWDVDGELHELPTFDPTGSGNADAVNERGDFVGSARVGLTSHCAWWPADTHAIEDCDVDPAGTGLSFGMALSNVGPHIVGTFIVGGEPQRGFLREPDGTIVPLPLLPGQGQCVAVGINDDGLTVGWCFNDPPFASDPFSSECTVWQDDASLTPPTPVALSTLVVNGAGWELRRCVGVNRNGVILGDGMLNGVRTAFLAIPLIEVVEPPPAEPPTTPKPGKRPHKDKPARLADLLAQWHKHWEDRQDKMARWEAHVKAWKAAHGR
jgi:hypothetical protein